MFHNQTVNDRVAHSKNPKKCAHHVTFDLDLDNTLDAGLPGDYRVQVWSRSNHLPARSHFCASTKVPISRDLYPWTWPWAHPGCMLTWSPSCASLVPIRPFACEKKRFVQKFTDGRTERRRTPCHCISSFLEWAKNDHFSSCPLPLDYTGQWSTIGLSLYYRSRTIGWCDCCHIVRL